MGTPETVAADSTQPASRVRYGVLAFLCALTFILYLDRICIQSAAEYIMDDLKFDKRYMGWVLSAFALSYAVFEIPMGRWGDRYGSRGVLTRIVVWWSVFTALTGAAPGFWSLLVIRFLFGAGEAGALPNAALVTSRWFPASARGRAQGMLTTFMLLGGVFAPPTAEKLIQLLGWRWTFAVFGAIGVVWAVAFYIWFRDDPSKHPAVNAAERNLIQSGRTSASGHAHGHPPIPWHLALTSANIWLLSTAIVCGTFTSYLYYTWYKTYMREGRGVDADSASWLTSLVLAGGAIGCTFGGFLGDWLLRKTGGNRRFCRRLTGSGGFAVASVCLFCSVYCESPVAAASLTALSFMSAQIQLATWWVTATEVTGKHVGALFGMMNMIGSLVGAFLNPIFIGQLTVWLQGRGLEGRAQWDPMFYVFSGVYVVGAIVWSFVDASKAIKDEEPSDAHEA